MSQTEIVLRLNEADLLVKPIGLGFYTGGYTIVKPASILGNTRANWEIYFGPEEILCDATRATLYPKNQKWRFQIWESVPGPGPGDFQVDFLSIRDAVDAILDYYFGDPSKMNPPELLAFEEE